MTPGWMKILVGSVVVFVLSAIFWLGETYQRFSGMEAHLSNIDTQLSRIGDESTDLRVLKETTQENQHRLERLEDQVRQLR